MNDSKKISLREFIWMGFSFISSVSFLGNFQALSNANQVNSVGINIIWIFILEGVIAGLCAWAFAKLSRVHSVSENGAAYIYTRTAYGRFIGFLVGFMQYVTMPFVISIQIMMLMRGMFDSNYTGPSPLSNITQNWGPFKDLYLDLMGVLLYMFFALGAFFGIKIYKKLSIVTGYIKWGTALLLIIAGLVLAFMNGHSNYAYWFSPQGTHFSMMGFLTSFTSCFFFFTGFEQIASSTKNIQNPEKNISKGLLWSMGIVTTMYVVVSFIFFGAVSSFSQNMNISTWNGFNLNWLVLVGALIMLSSQLALKAQIAMMNCFIGGVLLQPMSKEGYISEKYQTLNKDNMPERAALLNGIITLGCVMLWLIIPDVINGILVSRTGDVNAAIPFNISMLSSAASGITLFVYSMVVSVILYQGFKNNLKVATWEWIVFPMLLLFLLVNYVYHYYTVINGIVSYANGKAETSTLVASVVELSFIVAVMSSVVLIYTFYYLPKCKDRNIANPKLQLQLNSAFMIHDPGLIAKSIEQTLKPKIPLEKVK